MAADDYYSDSEDENLDGVETDVLLGVPDGEIKSSTDLVDPAVSRMGGLPAFLPSTRHPSHEISLCKVCSKPMKLLVQMWCPFESSPLDRVLYIWGCNRSGCQFKDGSIRAYRSLKFNERYAAKLEKKQAKAKLSEATKTEINPTQTSTTPMNPFSFDGSEGSKAGEGFIFGSGSLFEQGGSRNIDETNHEGTVSSTAQNGQPGESDDDEPPATTDELVAMTEAMEQTTLSDDPSDNLWITSPTYVPQYLSTISEYLTPERVTNPPRSAQPTNNGNSLGAGWNSESYERSGTDPVFDKFKRVVGNEGSQCVRYDLSGVPLLYQTDAIFKRLFPPTRGSSTDRRAAALPSSELTKSAYDPSSIPCCPICNGPRAFECQLVPNLISQLKLPSTGKKQTEAERRNELARLLLKKDVGGAPPGGTTADEETGMEWGTCLIFSCLKDCCQEEGGQHLQLRQCWREEMVLVQWEN